MDINQLKQKFDQPEVRFYQRDQLIFVDIHNRFGQITFTPLGATLLSYLPKGAEQNVFWLSDTLISDGRKPIRGGVPICWPWFGDGAPNQPAHGCVRDQVWQIDQIENQAGATQINLSLRANSHTLALWPFDFKLTLSITLAESLTLQLIAENLSDSDWSISEALHSYFNVAQADQVELQGLDQLSYLDKNQNYAKFIQQGNLYVSPPLDYVYLDHHGDTVIKDLTRHILIEKQNSASTIVWNPGSQGAQMLKDMPDNAYPNMLCVEAGNALQNSYLLPAKQSHCLTLKVSVLNQHNPSSK